MKSALLHICLATALSGLSTAHSATFAAQVKGPVRPAASKPVTADNSVIPLPLTPIVPSSQRLCATRTASGLGVTVLRPATGAKPGADATVLVSYVGYLSETGAVFDQGMQTVMPVGGVIAGFSEGLQMIGRGGIVRLCIPASLGYGAQSSGPIPANSDLVFQVELVDFKTTAEMNAMREAERAEPPSPPPQP